MGRKVEGNFIVDVWPGPSLELASHWLKFSVVRSVASSTCKAKMIKDFLFWPQKTKPPRGPVPCEFPAHTRSPRTRPGWRGEQNRYKGPENRIKCPKNRGGSEVTLCGRGTHEVRGLVEAWFFEAETKRTKKSFSD